MSYIIASVLALFLLGATKPAAAQFACAGFEPPPTNPTARAAKISGNLVGQGDVHALVVFAKFRGEAPPTEQVPVFAADLLDPGQRGSLAHFYDTMSFDQFHLRGTVLPKRYSSNQPASAYLAAATDEVGDFGRFVREILEQMDEDIDFAQFDNDGPDGRPNSGDDDGLVDYLFVNMLSTPKGFLVGSATGVANLDLNGTYVTRDTGVYGYPIEVISGTRHGSISQEGTWAQTVGVMAHEFGHALDLPDLYDLHYEEPEDDSAGIGRWGLMGWGALGWHGDDGPNPFCAWSRERLGWIGTANSRIVEVRTDEDDLILQPLDREGHVVKIPFIDDRESINLYGHGRMNQYGFEEEYLLLEQVARTSTYYHRNLPAEGLLVWHIRSQKLNNRDEGEKGVDLVCADGLYRDAGYPLGQVADGREGRNNLDFWAHDAAYTETHGGNWGDASDVFDGVHTKRLDLDSNPSNRFRGRVSEASTGVELTLERQGESMLVALRQPRWAGTIREPVLWNGAVWIDGDVHVAPEGTLVIGGGTQVLFAGTDRLAGGRDPDRCELEIQGHLDLIADRGAGEVVFAPQRQTDNWYGIVLDPSDSSRIVMPEASFALRGSEHGLFFAAMPPDVVGPTLEKEYLFIDAFASQTVGNGDGRLNPGEIFRLGVVLDNWTVLSRQVRVEMRWDSELLTAPWQIPSAASGKQLSGEASLSIGGHTEVLLPSLHLSPQARDGQAVEIEIDVRAGAQQWQERLTYTVVGGLTSPKVDFAVPGREIRQEAVHFPVAQPSEIQVRVADAIETAHLLVWSMPQLEPVLELPMERQSDQEGHRVFSAAWQPATGWYRCFVRLQHRNGTVGLGERTLDAWTVWSPKHRPLLAILGESIADNRRAFLRQTLEEVGRAAGFTTLVIDRDFIEDGAYAPLLSQYLRTGRQLIWIDDNLNPQMADAVRAYAAEGGNFGLISGTWDNKMNTAFQREVLHFIGGQDKWEHGLWMAGALDFGGVSVPFDASVKLASRYISLQPVAPARPALVDQYGRAAGLWAQTPTHRLIYLPFSLNDVKEPELPALMEGLVAFFQQDAVEDASLEVAGHEAAEGKAGLTFEAEIEARAEIAGPVVAADLVVRTFPYLAPVAEYPMRRTGEVDGRWVFKTVFPPPDQRQYQLSLRPYNAGGQGLINDATWRGIHLATDRQVLIVLGKQYAKTEKNGLRTALGEIFAGRGMSVSFVDVIDENEEFYEAVLDHYTAPEKMVLWMGDSMSSKIEQVFARYLQSGGKAFFFSPRSYSSPSFHTQFLHVDKVRTISNRPAEVHSVHLENEVRFDAVYRTLEPRPPAESILFGENRQVAGLQVDAGDFRLVYLPFHLHGVDAEVYRSLIEAGVHFLYQAEAPVFAFEIVDHALVEGTLVLDADEQVRVRLHLEGEVERGELQVRSPLRSELEQVLPLRPVDRAEGTQIYEAVFRPPSAGRFELKPQFYNQVALHSQAHLPVLSMPPRQKILALIGQGYADEERKTLHQTLGRSVDQLGLDVAIVDVFGPDSLLYEALLEHHLVDENQLVVWIGASMDREIQELFHRLAQRGGKFFFISRDLGLKLKSKVFREEILHLEAAKGTNADMRTVYLDRPMTFKKDHAALDLLSPAEPFLLDSGDNAAGLQVDASAFRLVYLPFDLHRMDEEIYRPLVKSGIDFLLRQDVSATIEVVDHPLVEETLVLDAATTATVRLRVQGDVERAELQVRTWPQLQLVAVVPLHQTEDGDGKQTYETVFRPPAAGQYRLEPRLYNAAGALLHHAARLRVLGPSLERPVLVLIGQQYTAKNKKILETSLAQSLGQLGLSATFVDRLKKDEVLYRTLFAHYLDPGDVVIWLGDKIGEVEEKALSRFLEDGGRLFCIAHSIVSASQNFYQKVLRIEERNGTRSKSVRSLHPDLPSVFRKNHWRLLPHASAQPVLVNDAGEVAGLQVDAETSRLVVFPFDLPLNAWEAFAPSFERELTFLRQEVIHQAQWQGTGSDAVVSIESDRPIEAVVQGEIEGVELVVHSVPRYEWMVSLPMAPVQRRGEAQVFSATFQPPHTGLYHLSLRLRTPDGKTWYSGNHRLGLAVDPKESALVILGKYPLKDKELILRQTCSRVLQDLGLDFAIVEQSETIGTAYAELFSHYLDGGRMIIWLSEDIDKSASTAMRRFLEDGGRLLVSALRSPLSLGSAFLQEMLHVRTVKITARPVTSDLRSEQTDAAGVQLASVQFRPLVIEGAAEPVLLDGEGRIAGVRVQSTYEVINLSFALSSLDKEAQYAVLETQIRSLLPKKEAALRFMADRLTRSVLPLETWDLQVEVANGGDAISEAFQVGYQIVHEGQVITSLLRPQDPLEGQGRRTVRLSPWTPATEGRYEVRFSLNAEDSEEIIDQPVRHFEVVAVPPPLEAVALPGDLSKGNGAGFFDYDGDGDLDLYLVRRGGANRLLRNDGDAFVESAQDAGLPLAAEGTDRDRGLAFGDYDGDGDLDLYLVAEDANRFFGNQGNGTFVDITDQLAGDSTAVGLDDAGSGRSAGFFDSDNDGDLDLYLVNATEGPANRLFRNERGLYVERATELGLADEGNGRGLAIGDYDGDGRVDLFVANVSGDSKLWRNQGDTFTPVNDTLDLAFDGGEVAAVFADYDGDGRTDLFVANQSGSNRLFRNAGDTFHEVTGEALDLGDHAVGSLLADYDNDGDLDLITTALGPTYGGDQIYHQRGQDLLPVGALLALADSSAGRGLSAGDYDNDGDLDLLVADATQSRLYRNQVQTGHWLQVELHGIGLNRYGIGARVEAVVGTQRWVRQIQSGYGYASQVEPRLHFGLGTASQVDTLQVVWPDGRTQEIGPVDADQRLQIAYPNAPTAVAADAVLPEVLQLWPNYPNPFNNATAIRFDMPREGAVELVVYNLMGQRVAVLVAEELAAGAHRVTWNGRDENGRELASGMYLYRLQAGERTQTRKLLLLQ